MNRIHPLNPTEATGKTGQLLGTVQSKLGLVPNLFRVLAHSPAALEGYVSFSGALAGGSLSAKVREQIALAVAEGNLCGYCLSAHSFIGSKVGLSEKEIADARESRADSAKTDAILKLALSIVVQRGEVSDTALSSARSAGLTEGEIVETVGHVAVNIFTNYINHVAQTVVDFPEVKPGEPATTEGNCTTSDCGCVRYQADLMNPVLLNARLLCGKMRGQNASLPARAATRQVLLAAVGGSLAIGAVGCLAAFSGHPMVLGSFGASCVLLFGFPESPLSQPRNVILGHMLCSLVGLTALTLVGPHWWAMAVATGAAIALMMITRTVHPPAGSNPIIVFLSHPSWTFLFTPTFLGAVLLVFIAALYLNLTREKAYPSYWVGRG